VLLFVFNQLFTTNLASADQSCYDRRMVKTHPQVDEWRRRLSQLESLAQTPSPLAWLYEIRAKVVRYCLSRYGLAPPPMRVSPPPTPVSRSKPIIKPDLQSGQPAKDRRVIRELLERIHKTVRTARMNPPQ